MITFWPHSHPLTLHLCTLFSLLGSLFLLTDLAKSSAILSPLWDICADSIPLPCVHNPHATLHSHHTPYRPTLLASAARAHHSSGSGHWSVSSSLACAFPGEGVLPGGLSSSHRRTELSRKWDQGEGGKCPFPLYCFLPTDTPDQPGSVLGWCVLH